MVSFTVKAVGAAAAAGLLAQQVQCPMGVAYGIIAGVGATGSFLANVGGAVVCDEFNCKREIQLGNFIKRQEAPKAPAGVPQFEFERCFNDVTGDGVALNVQGPVSNNGVQVDGVPPTCMNLAAVITGDVDGPPPTPCGSACLLYDNLNEEDYSEMHQLFTDWNNAS